MNKHYAVLLAILLPFSGYGITKKERMAEINEIVKKMVEEQMEFQMKLLCTPWKIATLSSKEGEEIVKKCDEYMNRLTELEREFEELKEQNE